jgi:hypothetical protein
MQDHRVLRHGRLQSHMHAFARWSGDAPYRAYRRGIPQRSQILSKDHWEPTLCANQNVPRHLIHGCAPFTIHILSWMQSATSSVTSFKSKVPQVNPVIRPAHDPEKQGAHAKPSGDLNSHDQIRNKSPDPSHVATCDKSRDSICFGRARSPLINKWQTVGMVCNQQRHVTPVIG